MRIISQGGHADLPYEEIALCISCEDIIARHNDKEYLMARYSTMEKAQKAMEMLFKEYGEHYFCQGGAMATENFYVPPFAFIPPKVFQFPQDEDVEV